MSNTILAKDSYKTFLEWDPNNQLLAAVKVDALFNRMAGKLLRKMSTGKSKNTPPTDEQCKDLLHKLRENRVFRGVKNGSKQDFYNIFQAEILKLNLSDEIFDGHSVIHSFLPTLAFNHLNRNCRENAERVFSLTGRFLIGGRVVTGQSRNNLAKNAQDAFLSSIHPIRDESREDHMIGILSTNSVSRVLSLMRGVRYYDDIAKYIHSAYEFRDILKLSTTLELNEIEKTLQFYLSYYTSDLLFKMYPISQYDDFDTQSLDWVDSGMLLTAVINAEAWVDAYDLLTSDVERKKYCGFQQVEKQLKQAYIEAQAMCKTFTTIQCVEAIQKIALDTTAPLYKRVECGMFDKMLEFYLPRKLLEDFSGYEEHLAIVINELSIACKILDRYDWALCHPECNDAESEDAETCEADTTKSLCSGSKTVNMLPLKKIRVDILERILDPRVCEIYAMLPEDPRYKSLSEKW